MFHTKSTKKRKKNTVIDVEGKLLERFPDYSNTKNQPKLKITTEGLYSLSHWKDANLTSKLISRHMNGRTDITITDGTANVGGNVISFAKMFKKVNAVEIDKTNYKVLKNNIQVYELHNVEIFNDDYTKILRRLRQDVVFLDPPWGGVGYKQHKHLDLSLGGEDISHWCRVLLENKRTKLIVLKVPKNFNKKKFSIHMKVVNLQKYDLLFLSSS